jgi:acyl carrier protein
MVSNTRDSRRKDSQDHSRERDLFALVREVVADIQPKRAKSIEITAASRIERDLGIDSLGRTELILRIERAFGVRMPIEAMGRAETVADFVQILRQAQPEDMPETGKMPLRLTFPPVAAAIEARTLVDVLERHVAQHPDRQHLTVLQDHRTELGSMTYADLANMAREIATGLIRRGISVGDRIALMLPTGLDFFATFFGVLYAGAIPVPIYPPAQLTDIEEHLRRQAGILRNAGARILVTIPEALKLAALLRGLVATIESVESAASLAGDSSRAGLPTLHDSDAMALIQYTSGSTGDPKGVVLSHANVLANIRSFGRAINASSADVLVSWLPLYHDMGLIGTWLGCLYFGAPFYAMSPLAFLARPQSWLWAMHRYGATISAAPNFAFELCLSKIEDADLEGLDLSSLRMLVSGAEPVNAQTLYRFIERFSRFGFRREAMAPSYGLAENVVALTLPLPGGGPIIDRVDREALTVRGIAEPARADDPRAMEIVACGQPIPDHEIRIVDDAGRELDERHEGRLQFRGPSATSGYFNNMAKTRELFQNGWLDSGDRAYTAGGDLFITGRVKDIIIRAGQHIYPHEVEEAVAAVPGVRKAGAAAFGVIDPSLGTERVVILAESSETGDAGERVRALAQQAAATVLGAPPDDVMLLRPGTIPKTASRKVRRAAARDLYLRGHIDLPRHAIRWQLWRLWFAGLATNARRVGIRVRELLYAVEWWAVIGIGFALGSIAVLVLPRLRWRWATVRTISRAAFAVTGVPLSVSGLDRLPRGNAMIVFNHASYTDNLVLAATLPGAPLFVAKKEFAVQAFVELLLRRLGALFVDRYELTEAITDIQAVIAAARQGRIVVIYPEGTFSRRAGLSAFYLGAFKIAAEAALPVFPGIMRGTRSLLRSGQWLPRRVPVSVEIGEAIMPRGRDFASVVSLRDAVREVVLKRCGEPDLRELLQPPPPQAAA